MTAEEFWPTHSWITTVLINRQIRLHAFANHVDSKSSLFKELSGWFVSRPRMIGRCEITSEICTFILWVVTFLIAMLCLITCIKWVGCTHSEKTNWVLFVSSLYIFCDVSYLFLAFFGQLFYRQATLHSRRLVRYWGMSLNVSNPWQL